MSIRIDPRVDFAFKLMLGSPQHSSVTVHFLNAVLRPTVPIVSVEILNPLVGKDRSEDKIIVLDVLARDALGRLFNIEMQTRIPLSFPSRLLYYNSKNYLRQLKEGDGYEKLRPAISICLLDRRMFDQPSESQRWHHSFRLRCDQNMELVLTENFEFHIFELPKFEPTSDNIGELPADEKWLYLLTHAAEVEPEDLANQLGESAYREAIGVLEMISKSPEDLQYYEDRLKFLRDERGKLDAARQEGEQIGVAKGRQEGRQEGNLAGKIQTLQELLGDRVSTDEELLAESVTALTTQLQRLRDRLNKRDA
jgi:predicted transposase/invertase (TIGR01784 family)